MGNELKKEYSTQQPGQRIFFELVSPGGHGSFSFLLSTLQGKAMEHLDALPTPSPSLSHERTHINRHVLLWYFTQNELASWFVGQNGPDNRWMKKGTGRPKQMGDVSKGKTQRHRGWQKGGQAIKVPIHEAGGPSTCLCFGG